MTPSGCQTMVRQLMTEFAASTGLSPSGKLPRRYLWTDAFAVCNFLKLYRQTGDESAKQLAVDLVDQVHHVLGRHRQDDPRTGWLSGLDEPQGKLHPTQGGLRIGKPLPERKPAEPFDEQLEWERDGQYYHYLTKWMHALNRVSRVTGDATYNTWAIELAKTAHARFTYLPASGGQKRLYWKMSIDLSYPLVPPMGQHDPLDGFITYIQLQATAAKHAEPSPGLDLTQEIHDMAQICAGRSWATDDPLGIGGLLDDACKVAQLILQGRGEHAALLETLLESAQLGLGSYVRDNPVQLPAEHRLAFRELGLAIGLRAVEKVRGWVEDNPDLFNKRPSLRLQLEILQRYVPLGETIEEFWCDPSHRAATSWTAHGDINMVMLATSLAPDGYLLL